jgi:hypothetical protein
MVESTAVEEEADLLLLQLAKITVAAISKSIVCFIVMNFSVMIAHKNSAAVLYINMKKAFHQDQAAANVNIF